MTALGNGLYAADHSEDALSVDETRLSMMRRLGAPEANILAAQGNLAVTYQRLGRREEALSMREDVYSRRLKLFGEEHEDTLAAANNYGSTLNGLQRYAETKSLLRNTTPLARRVLGECDRLTLKIRWNYALALFRDNGATLDDLREAVTTLEDAGRIALRVLGGAHPNTTGIERALRNARAALRTRETPSPGSA